MQSKKIFGMVVLYDTTDTTTRTITPASTSFRFVLYDTTDTTTRTITPASTSFRFGLDKSSRIE